MRRLAKILLMLAGIVVVVDLVDTVFTAWAWRSRNPRALRLAKISKKHVINPVMLRFSGRSGLTATLHHRGRRSAKAYATPVIAHRSDDEAIIPLPYGADVDWLRNILAAERAVVDLGGESLEVDEPAIVGIDDVLDRLPDPMTRAVRFNRAREAVLLHVAAGVPTAASRAP